MLISEFVAAAALASCSAQWDPMSLVPADLAACGFRNDSFHSWGGNVLEVVEGQNSQWHLYAAAFVEGCGLDAWEVNSAVIHAVSSAGPTGPFAYSDIALPVWHHNPQAVQVNDPASPTGSYFLIYTIGMDPQGRVDNCTRVETLRPVGAGPVDAVRLRARGHGFEVVQVWYSVSPYGPWTLYLNGSHPGDPYAHLGNLINGTNPAPWVLANGTVVLASHNSVGVTLSVADSWRGPYSAPVPVVNYSQYCSDAVGDVGCVWDGYVAEDPFLWQGTDGLWRVLVHQYNSSAPHPQYRVGGYAQSATSDPFGPWALQPQSSPAFTTLVDFQDGSAQNMSRRERPKLFFNSTTGQPAVLYTGVCPPGNTNDCWTLAQNIAQ